MKKGLFVIGFIFLSISPAQANECPAGARCGIEVNCTTGVTTYHVLPNLPINTTPLVQPVIVTPTHTLSVKTANQSFGVVGTPEQIQTTVNQMVARVTAPIEIDPCVNGGCNKIEVNATTQEVKISSLSTADIQQRNKDRISNIAKEAELAKIVTQALPNIQTLEEAEINNGGLFIERKITPLTETEPDWWTLWLSEWAKYAYWFYSFNWQL